VLMDFEMPIMDGMTALQHLMIHVPTPTIMFSRITKEGTARCFDALKNGAVDFFCKDNLPTKRSDTLLMQELTERVVCASNVFVNAVEPIFPPAPNKKKNNKFVKTLVFCEECGAKTEIVVRENEDQGGVICTNCKEYISLQQRNKHRRANYLTTVMGGEGSYINLLKLVPNLPQDINGAVMLLIDGTVEHVDAFARYLNSISTVNVVRIEEDTTIKGGNCYVGCESETVTLKPYSADYSVLFDKKEDVSCKSFDRTMISAAKVFRERNAVVFISGSDKHGASGIREILSLRGNVAVLNPKRCLFKDMVLHVIDTFSPSVIENEEKLAEQINILHSRYRDTIVTA